MFGVSLRRTCSSLHFTVPHKNQLLLSLALLCFALTTNHQPLNERSSCTAEHFIVLFSRSFPNNCSMTMNNNNRIKTSTTMQNRLLSDTITTIRVPTFSDKKIKELDLQSMKEEDLKLLKKEGEQTCCCFVFFISLSHSPAHITFCFLCLNSHLRNRPILVLLHS